MLARVRVKVEVGALRSLFLATSWRRFFHSRLRHSSSVAHLLCSFLKTIRSPPHFVLHRRSFSTIVRSFLCFGWVHLLRSFLKTVRSPPQIILLRRSFSTAVRSFLSVTGAEVAAEEERCVFATAVGSWNGVVAASNGAAAASFFSYLPEEMRNPTTFKCNSLYLTIFLASGSLQWCDLSFNNLSGQLLSSTRSLSSLITLYGNKCGSVAISFFELQQISSSFFDSELAVVLDQGLEDEILVDIQKYLEDFINSGLRQRLISLIKVFFLRSYYIVLCLPD
ncbi:hypothetical protein RIF29_09354 [Crotalaria pallida]|uniref:Uncharacterized protein n=1 Tax=Crotalaria pallida TaxID=3830 RepID=A0AAN9FRU9_CROPI